MSMAREWGALPYRLRAIEASRSTLVQRPASFSSTIFASRSTTASISSEVAMLMAYEVTRDLPLRPVEIETPMGMAHCHMLEGRNIALVPILRAGLGMVAGMTNLIPMAKIGHIGLYRDPVTLEPIEYYCKLPEDVQQRDVILLDPMLATGGSAAAAVDFLKMREIKDIKFVCLVAAPEGIKHFHGAHPEIPIYCAALDDGLDDHAYILPGLGDAGDRLFGTK